MDRFLADAARQSCCTRTHESCDDSVMRVARRRAANGRAALTRIRHAMGGRTGGARVTLARIASLLATGLSDDATRIDKPTLDSNAPQYAPHALMQHNECV
jgi:hypothetical protein